MRQTTIELFKENMKFSAGHFTIFSATERENLHGHNYQVHAAINTTVTENGLSFDYRTYKKKLKAICKHLNSTFLLPSKSKFLAIEEQKDFYICHFNQEKIPFLKTDATLLPISNITVEELSNWILQQMLIDQTSLAAHVVSEIEIKVFSGPGQCANAKWSIDHD